MQVQVQVLLAQAVAPALVLLLELLELLAVLVVLSVRARQQKRHLPPARPLFEQQCPAQRGGVTVLSAVTAR